MSVVDGQRSRGISPAPHSKESAVDMVDGEVRRECSATYSKGTKQAILDVSLKKTKNVLEVDDEENSEGCAARQNKNTQTVLGFGSENEISIVEIEDEEKIRSTSRDSEDTLANRVTFYMDDDSPDTHRAYFYLGDSSEPCGGATSRRQHRTRDDNALLNRPPSELSRERSLKRASSVREGGRPRELSGLGGSFRQPKTRPGSQRCRSGYMDRQENVRSWNGRCSSNRSSRHSPQISTFIERLELPHTDLPPKERRRRTVVLIVVCTFLFLLACSVLVVIVTLTHSSFHRAPTDPPWVRKENEELMNMNRNDLLEELYNSSLTTTPPD